MLLLSRRTWLLLMRPLDRRLRPLPFTSKRQDTSPIVIILITTTTMRKNLAHSAKRTSFSPCSFLLTSASIRTSARHSTSRDSAFTQLPHNYRWGLEAEQLRKHLL